MTSSIDRAVQEAGLAAHQLDRRRRDEDRRDDFLRRGTLPPSRRAWESPIAIACLRLVTFFPERPLRSVPRLRSRITWRTFCEAFLPYLRAIRMNRWLSGFSASFLFDLCFRP